ncbi:uncharacterized protein EDB93DRAFT_1179241 [Suillus bovinus]|uniref:uncharacterized protein n=1 Tax=Suillus bovinus TaxID=48563 RepID=UPI001B85EEF4|nr:uncharacterized protein EDB93DRAFT_1179241 [Suillus bovinus]KAG2130775.1 hypothetical protein EDB93DRAFT_1179241 [Suillus bovinus]
MPNLQSTSTDDNHTVKPQLPDNANSSFDALIDLLASDDVHDIAVVDSHPHHTIPLRDASGKLAFDKIRLMFATKNLGPDRIDNKSFDIRPDTSDQLESDAQDALSKSGLPRSASPSSQSSERRRQRSRSASASSSTPLDKKIQSANTLHSASSAYASPSSSADELVRIRSDEQIRLSQDELNAQINIIDSLPHDKIPLLHQVHYKSNLMRNPNSQQ